MFLMQKTMPALNIQALIYVPTHVALIRQELMLMFVQEIVGHQIIVIFRGGLVRNLMVAVRMILRNLSMTKN